MGETSAYIVLKDDVEKHRDVYEEFAENPPCSFAGSGVVLGDDGLSPLPYEPYDAVCPFCGDENYEMISACLQTEDGIDENIKFKCPKCKMAYGMKEVNSGKSKWYLAKNYIFLSDIDLDEWEDGSMKLEIMSIIPGSIDIVNGWMT